MITWQPGFKVHFRFSMFGKDLLYWIIEITLFSKLQLVAHLKYK